MSKLVPVPATPKDAEADQIIKLHNTMVFFGNQTLMIAVRCGKLLAAKKRSLGHGRWLPWIDHNLPFSSRTAERYIKVWENSKDSRIAYELEQDTLKALKEPKRRLSLRQFYLMLTDSKSVRLGLNQADKARMIRDLVKPIRTVKNRLKYLPWLPSSQEDLDEVIAELHEAIGELLAELRA